MVNDRVSGLVNLDANLRGQFPDRISCVDVGGHHEVATRVNKFDQGLRCRTATKF